jgi:Rrf2 family cysteine metabolism transcriptional repressor
VRGPGANAKTRYGVQAVIYLARQERERVVPVSEIAISLAISPKFLEDILGALRTAGIVRSRRGKEGGYMLTTAPEGLTVLAVVRAMEGPDSSPERETDGPLGEVTRRVFECARAAAVAQLAERTIDQLVEDARRLEGERAEPYMYHL